MKNSEIIGNRTRVLTVCGAVPQPSAPQLQTLTSSVYVHVCMYICVYAYVYIYIYIYI